MGGVLFVEDDDDLRENLQFLLRRRGFAVKSAEHGAAALACIDPDDPPCIIIADLMMPVMDGWELRQRLRADPRLAAIPLVLCSGVADLEEKAQELDALAHLTKPLDLERLYELVGAHC